MAALIVQGAFCLLLLICPQLSTAKLSHKPNIVFILTDDQDVELSGQTPIEKTRKLIGEQGITFDYMYVSAPLCCPSRSSILTGKFVHNHLAVNNSLEGGCSNSHWQNTQEPSAFPVYLKQQGYKTMFAGKYLNQYGTPKAGGVGHIPPGWDWWTGLVGNSKYYHYSISDNGTKVSHGGNYKTDYFTDVIHRKGMSFLDEQTSDSGPFFMMLSTPACHGPFTPAPQYANEFANKEAPRDGSYNVHAKDKHWLLQQTITPLPNDTVNMEDNVFRNRWRTLISVDDMVEDVMMTLQKKNLLNNTYVFFSSDNGFHLGQFSMPSDKRQLYEFDVRVPLMVRGPKVPSGIQSKVPVMNVDLAPTFIALTGQEPPPQMDGISLLPIIQPNIGPVPHWERDVLIEHQGEYHDTTPGCPKFLHQDMANCNNHCVCEDSRNNTYACMVNSNSQTFARTKYCQIYDDAKFEEYYDLVKDPYELVNGVSSLPTDELNKLRTQLTNLVKWTNFSTVEKLRSDLLTGYEPSLRPGTDQSIPLNISVGLSMTLLREFDEVTSSFSMIGYLNVKWIDHRLQWISSNYEGLTKMVLLQSDVWVPPILLVNPSHSFDLLGFSTDRVQVMQDGSVNWLPPDLFQFICEADVTHFPFDEQTCAMALRACGYSISDLNMQHASDRVSEASTLTENGIWEIIESSSSSYIDMDAQVMRFSIIIRRRPGFYIVNLVLPIMAMLVLQLFVFLLPVESGERIGYSITILLAISVFFSIITDFIPETVIPNLPIICYKLIVDFFLCTLITILAIMSLRCHNEEESKKIPLVLVLLTKKLRSLKNDTNRVEDIKQYDDSSKTTKDDVWDCEQSLTWKEVSLTIDKLSLYVFSVILFFENIVFLGILMFRI
ncbi:hypothetical protein FSP39_003556 [Pinctada imbricata]|uniref:N-acetylglucosamine-6-sulfatase n=1 Tax=Pinctada imbricata TaxID=66713 RepID=A0AA88YAC1_PINIB|nr:hypothetical protein FSP39_003556 [Pinctada imbricata]